MFYPFKKIKVSSIFLVLIGQVLAVGFLLWLMAGWVFPFTTDSMVYISTAENIVRFKGLLFTNFFVRPPFPDVLPLSIWPPGYPISIAVLKWMGVNEYAAALILPRLCCLFLPFLFWGIFRRLIAENIALFASGMCSLTFSVLSSSVFVWSDTPYLSLCLLVLMMTFDIIEKKTSVHWSVILLAGVLSGVAFLIRYIGISLIASIGICLIIGFMIRAMTFKDLMRMICFYGLGVCLPVVPYIVRNLVVFGTVSAYSYHVSKAVFLSNLVVVVRLYFQGLSSMVFGKGSFTWIIVAFMIVSVGWFLGRARDLIKESPTKFIYIALLLVYFFSQSVLLIYYRSEALIPGNPDIDGRLMMQLSWILLGGAIFAVHAGLKGRYGEKGIKVFIFFLVLSFVLIQVFTAVEFYKTQTKIKVLSRKISQYFPARGIPADYVIVSNVPEITNYFAKRDVRAIDNYTPGDLLYNLGPYRKFVVFLVKGAGQLSPAWQYADEWRKPGNYKLAYLDQEVDLLVPLVKVSVRQIHP